MEEKRELLSKEEIDNFKKELQKNNKSNKPIIIVLMLIVIIGSIYGIINMLNTFNKKGENNSSEEVKQEETIFESSIKSNALSYIKALEKQIEITTIQGIEISDGIYEINELQKICYVNHSNIEDGSWIKINNYLVTEASLKIRDYVVDYDGLNFKTIKGGSIREY